MIEAEKYYTTEELSKYWQVSPRTITRMIKKQELHALRVGRQFRIKGESILEYEVRNTQEPKE